MAVTAACFKWADVLENQFDKSWVELDSLLAQLEDDEDFGGMHLQGRRAASSLASCFSQFAHKSTTVFQTNAKLEAELVHLREELSEANGTKEAAVKEKKHVTVLLQEALLKRQYQNGQQEHSSQQNGENEVGANGVKEEEVEKAGNQEDGCMQVPEEERLSVTPTPLDYLTERQKLMENHSVSRLLAENKRLRAELLELESEMVGARLDNVYLDKELAGRIQQIQLLLATKTPVDRKEKMWTQIESEMCLQRSKTIAQMCKTKQEVKGRMREESSRPLPTPGPVSLEEEEPEGRRGKQAMILKNPADDLGMAIIGGREHNLPIIISEIFPGTAVARSNRINAGDIILSVNGEDFTEINHHAAVSLLSSLRGQIILELKSSEAVSEDDPSNLDYRFYKIFDPAITKEGVDAASVSEYSSRRGSTTSLASHPGRAVSLNRLDRVSNGGQDQDIPSVHSSPRRAQPQNL